MRCKAWSLHPWMRLVSPWLDFLSFQHPSWATDWEDKWWASISKKATSFSSNPPTKVQCASTIRRFRQAWWRFWLLEERCGIAWVGRCSTANWSPTSTRRTLCKTPCACAQRMSATISISQRAGPSPVQPSSRRWSVGWCDGGEWFRKVHLARCVEWDGQADVWLCDHQRRGHPCSS